MPDLPSPTAAPSAAAMTSPGPAAASTTPAVPPANPAPIPASPAATPASPAQTSAVRAATSASAAHSPADQAATSASPTKTPAGRAAISADRAASSTSRAASSANRAASSRGPAIAVALPGTGSDAHFARRAFGSACAAVDLPFLAVDPDPRRVIESYRAALDAAARSGPILIAGISLGAAVAVDWAAEHPDSAYGVIAALPAWTGADTTGCPAALSAAATAAQLRADGLDAMVTRMRESSPAWLADALTRSWTSQWPDLPAALEEAAAYRWPEPDLLARVTAPVEIIGATDDPVHPFAVAERWTTLIPHATLHTITLDELGADPAILGTRGLNALLPRRVPAP